jgi:hypothetical protein
MKLIVFGIFKPRTVKYYIKITRVFIFNKLQITFQ